MATLICFALMSVAFICLGADLLHQRKQRRRRNDDVAGNDPTSNGR